MYKAIRVTHPHRALPTMLLIGLALALVLGACQLTTASPTPQPTAEPTVVPVSSSGNTAEDGGNVAPARGSLGEDESQKESPNEAVEPVEGESRGGGSSGSAGGGTVSSGTAKAELLVDASVSYQWVGEIVVSELRGVEFSRPCDTQAWALSFDSPEVEAKAVNSAGLKVILWGRISPTATRMAIVVEAAYLPDDPMPRMYVSEYPCYGTVEPVPAPMPVPYPGPSIDLLPGEVAALGTLAHDGDAYYLETPSGRILLKGDVGIITPFMSESETLAPDIDRLSIVCLDYYGSYGYGTQEALPSEADAPVQNPDAVEVEPETGVAEPALSEVEGARSPYWGGDVIVVGAWFVDGGQLVIAVRYVQPWGSYCVYPEPMPLPEPMPVPDLVEDAGVLYGQVKIGPLCPVEPCTGRAADVYSSRALILESSDGAVIYVPLLPDGWFKEMVKAGVYVVNLTDCDFMGCKSALPVKVAITANEVTELMLDIDTGIR